MELVGIWWVSVICLSRRWPVQKLFGSQRRFLLHAWQHIAVNVHGDRNAGMTHSFTNNLWVYPCA